MLHGPDIEASTEHPGRIGRAKLAEVKAGRIELGTPSNRLASVEQVQFPVASWGREHKPAVLEMRMGLQLLHELLRNRHFPLFPALGRKAQFQLGCDANCLDRKVNVLPPEMDDFLFAKSGQKKSQPTGEPASSLRNIRKSNESMDLVLSNLIPGNNIVAKPSHGAGQ